MENWANHVLSFSGEPKNVAALLDYFKQVIYHHLSDFYFNEQDVRELSLLRDNCIFFQSTIDPATVLEELATLYDVGFIHRFNDRDSYGIAVFTDKTLALTCLDLDDFNHVIYDWEAKAYGYNNLSYPTERLVLDQLMLDKINSNQQDTPKIQASKEQKR